MKKNVASQKVGAQLVSATDGSAFTGSVTVAVTGDAGTQATGSVGSGACTHEGNGYHTYAPAQAETNYDLVAFTFTGTGAVPVTVQIYTLPTTGILAPTVADRTLDVSATGEAGLDFNNVLSSGLLTLHSLTITNALTVSQGATFASSTGDALTLASSFSGGTGLNISGNGSGYGAYIVGGATGVGMRLSGGASGGEGLAVVSQSASDACTIGKMLFGSSVTITGAFTATNASNDIRGTALSAAQHQIVLKEIYKCSGTVWCVTPTGNDSTGDGLTLATAYATGKKAASVAADGDIILACSGTIAEGDNVINLPDGVSLFGAGMGATRITSEAVLTAKGCIVKPGTRSLIQDLTIEGTWTDGTYQACIGVGAVVSQSGFTDAVAQRLFLIADTDGLYINKASTACSMTLADSHVHTKYDSLRLMGNASNAVDVVGVHCIAAGPSAAGPGYSRAVAVRNGRLRMFGGSARATDGGSHTVGLETDNAAGIIEAYGVVVSASSAVPEDLQYDVYTSAGAITLADCQYNTTSGSVTVTPTHGVNVLALSGDSTAADNAEAFFDGTGYAGTGNTIPTVTTVTNGVTLADGSITSAKIASSGLTAIAAAIWDALTSGMTTVGSIGKKLADATFGSGGGDATLAKQNEILARINPARVVYQGPVSSDLTATIIQGDDYLDADGEALSWIITDYTGPSVSGATAALRIMQLEDFNEDDTAAELTVTATAAMVGDDLVLKADLTAAQTAALSASPPSDKWNYIYQVVVTLSNGHTVTPARATGAMTVSKRIV